MSATAALVGPVHYKEQLKLMRAKTAADWTIDGLARAIAALAAPTQPNWLDEAVPPQKRYYGAFY